MEIQNQQVSLREAVIEDLEKISIIEKESNPIPWSPKSLGSEISGKNQFWVVTDDETDEKIFGFLIFSAVGEEAHVLEIAVGVPFKRQGLGRYIIQRMISFALRKGHDSIYLEVRSENEEAIKFYQSLGFVVIHRKSKYYSDGADAFSMIFRMSDKEPTIEAPEAKQ